MPDPAHRRPTNPHLSPGMRSEILKNGKGLCASDAITVYWGQPGGRFLPVLLWSFIHTKLNPRNVNFSWKLEVLAHPLKETWFFLFPSGSLRAARSLWRHHKVYRKRTHIESPFRKWYRYSLPEPEHTSKFILQELILPGEWKLFLEKGSYYIGSLRHLVYICI